MVYENKRNGMKATLIRENTGKGGDGTYVLQYEDGKVNSVTASTFKRWWKKSDIQPVEEVKEKTKRTVSSGSVEVYIADVEKVLEAYTDIQVKKYDKIPNFVVLKKGKKTLMEIRFGRKKCVFNVRRADIYDALYEGSIEVSKVQNNYYLPEVIEVTEDVKSYFNKLIQCIYSRY